MTFESVNDEGVRKQETALGTAQLYYKITDNIYIILTCAHNFVAFDNVFML